MTSGKGASRFAALLLPVALCLAGCAGGAVKPVSIPRAQAMDHNRRGVEAEARGDRQKALAEFAEALRLHTSVDNTDGMIVALVNSARTQRLGGDLQSAQLSVERGASLLPGGSDLASELYYEKAKVLAAAGDLPAALEWAQRAEAAEQGEGRGRRLNLVAALKLKQGFPDQSGEILERALAANREAKLRGEEANSLRLLGEIHLLQGGYAKALECYQGALALDKELGFSGKIAGDLSGLGSVSAASGDRKGAIGWYLRALEASRAGGDSARAAATLEKLAQLYRLTGEVESARLLEEQRKELLASGVARE